jgi:site-specific DNA-cytosine methylase
MIEFGHLFAGIDGFGLGLSRAGHRTAWTCELGDFPNRVLRQRLPDAEHYRDVLELTNLPRVRGLSGGFPCQDLSNAGRRAGITGARSGLWGQYARIIGEVEPDLVLIENVPALLHRGFELVVRDLVTLGYRVEWDCLPAAAFGAPHLRDRVWIAAHRLPEPCIFGQPAALFPVTPGEAVATVGGDDDDDGATNWQRWPRAGWVDGDPGLVMPLQPLAPRTSNPGTTLLDAVSEAEGITWPTPTARDHKDTGVGRYGRGCLPEAVRDAELWPTPKASPSGPDYARAGREGSGGDDLATAVARDRPGALNPAWVEWLMGFPLGWTDPDTTNADLLEHPWPLGEPPGIPRTTAGTPLRRDRLTALGNALIPPAAEWLGHRYNTALARLKAPA